MLLRCGAIRALSPTSWPALVDADYVTQSAGTLYTASPFRTPGFLSRVPPYSIILSLDHALPRTFAELQRTR